MVKMSFFRICKLTTDSSLAYGGFYQLASMSDFKYHSVRLFKTDALCRPQGEHSIAKNTWGGWLDSLGSGILVGKRYFGVLQKY